MYSRNQVLKYSSNRVFKYLVIGYSTGYLSNRAFEYSSTEVIECSDYQFIIMFRRTSDIFRKTIQNFGSQKHAYFGGAVFAATAIALSDDELKKQPMYQTSVRKLSFAIKYTNRKGYLDDVILLENLREKLYPYSDSTNTDLLWRYARVLLEIALWTSSADKNRMATFLEAEKVGKKALENESPQSPNASAHKWYGITLVKLMDFRSDKKIDEAQKHLEKAVELDPTDVRSWQYLGLFCFI
uniref:TPR_REGION domain-containing protein n=1 Tax=Wuchereria bancrofti TaxID=6293 RepID=A0A1I8EU67_WUCBA